MYCVLTENLNHIFVFRQLFELQSQLNTLNQAVCGVWGQLMMNGGSSSNGSALASKNQDDKESSEVNQESS